MKRRYKRTSVDLKALSEKTEIPYHILYYRYRKGLPLEGPSLRQYKAFKREQSMREWAGELECETKSLYDRVRYYVVEHDMSEKKSLEYILEANGITK
jgi:hypothetical protein